MQPRQRLYFRFGIASCALGATMLPSAATATYSIAATDSQTQEVGGAITSCVGSLDVGIVYGSLPGVGVIHAQAQLDQRGRAKTRALELLEQGIDPAAIITEITRRELDQSFASRQYGIVDLSGRAAGFTGEQAQAYKNDQQGKLGTLAYSVQGNILTSQAVLDQATAAFEEPACDLAERLMHALEAGADNGEGDSRCTRNGIPTDSAFIQVDRPGQSEPFLQLSIAGTAPDNPLPQLREMFDAWRKTHPCAASSAPAAGSGGSGSHSSAGTSNTAGSGGAGSSTARISGAAGSGGTVSTAGASGGSTAGAPSGGSNGATGVSAAAGIGGARANSGGVVASLPGTASAGASAATSSSRPSSSSSAAAGTNVVTGTTASASSATESESGCTMIPGAARTSASWFILPMLGLLTRSARRRRNTARVPNATALR